jgi:hypothetical protein
MLVSKQPVPWSWGMNYHSGDRQKISSYRMLIGKEGIEQDKIPVELSSN